MKIKTKEMPINIYNLANCNQDQLNEISHLIETQSVSLKKNPAGFIFITKKEGKPLKTIYELASYYKYLTNQELIINLCLLERCN